MDMACDVGQVWLGGYGVIMTWVVCMGSLVLCMVGVGIVYGIDVM